MSRPKIACYTPVLNEAKHVERWADSARCADYLLMLDTGSTDETVALAESCGILTYEARISPFRFDDARNIAMSLIPSDADIMIQLDADEVFTEPNWRRHIDAQPKHKRYSYWLTNNSGSWGRVLRNNCHVRDGFRWEHPIHEVVQGPPPTCHLDELVIEHQPDKSKSRAYVLDMLSHWSAADPDDVRLLFYLGREYKYRARWDLARKALWKYVQHPKATWGPERSEAFLYLAEMDSEPTKWLWKSVAEAPGRREAFYYLAKHYSGRNEKVLALSFARIAAELTDPGVYMTHAAAWGEPFDKFLSKLEKQAG